MDAATGEQEWAFETGGELSSSPTVAEGTVFVGSDDDYLYAVDAATGEQEWAFETGADVESSPTVAEGTVFVGSKDDNLYAVDAGVSGSSEGSRVMLGTLGHHGKSHPGNTDTGPTATFEVEPTEPEVGEEVTFDASGSSDDSGIDTYEWDLNDDGTFEASGQTATTSFDSVGDYTITLRVTDTDDVSATTEQTISVGVQANGPGDVTGDGNPATDTDGDRRYEDVNGDGSASATDVQALFANRDSDAVQSNPELFDFNDSGSFSISDVQALFSELL